MLEGVPIGIPYTLIAGCVVRSLGQVANRDAVGLVSTRVDSLPFGQEPEAIVCGQLRPSVISEGPAQVEDAATKAARLGIPGKGARCRELCKGAIICRTARRIGPVWPARSGRLIEQAQIAGHSLFALLAGSIGRLEPPP